MYVCDGVVLAMFVQPVMHSRIAIGLLCLGFAGLATSQEPAKTSRHLFILSGQSNMTGELEKGFAEKVMEKFGAENTVIVRSMKSGRGIRFWVADYEEPASSDLGLSKAKDNGSEYPVLLQAVRKAGDARSFQTVTFVWMQGESDANRGLGAAYAAAFRELHKELTGDLGIQSMPVVIGRISDYGLHGEKADSWREVRAVQEKLAGEFAGAWVDTDDLNDIEGKPEGDLHYPGEQRVALGRRLGEKAVAVVTAKP